MSVPTSEAHAAPMTHRQVMEALSGLLLVLFVSMLSTTVVSTALPQIIGSLKGTQSQYTWVVTATLLASTATTPVWGKLADLISKKLLIQIAIVVFTLGSLLSGFAQNTEQLIAARAFQGLGLGGLQILTQIIIGAMVTPRERGRYAGYLGGVMALATVAGPLLGGVITDVSWLGWRWCFFIGVPLCVLAFFALQFTLKIPVIRKPGVHIDYLGAVLIAAGVSGLLIWVTFVGNTFPWLSWQTAAMAGGSLLVLVLAVRVEKRAAEPVVPLHVVVRREPALAIIASLSVGMAMFGGAVFLGQYFQIGRGYSPTKAGLMTIPLMLGIMVSSGVAGRLVTKTGKIKPYIVTGTIVLTIGSAMLAGLDHRTPLPLIAVAMLAVGTGVGMSMQNLVLLVQNAVPLHELGAASGAVTFFRSLGGTMGVSVLGAVLAASVSTSITEDLNELGIDSSGGTGRDLDLGALPGPIQEIVRAAYGDGTGHVFLISAAIAAVGIVAALLLKPVQLRDTMDLVAPAGPGTDAAAPPATAVTSVTRPVDATGNALDNGVATENGAAGNGAAGGTGRETPAPQPATTSAPGRDAEQ